MNPYDFARIDWTKPPRKKTPIWHHRLAGKADQQLYSGSMEIDVYAETPLFIADPRDDPADDRKPARSMQNDHGDYIIPGSSLKGMLRNVVETLGNGCLTLFDGDYERHMVRYRNRVPGDFQHCTNNTNLCIACRAFGMLKEREGGVFLGKVNIGDAVAYGDKVYYYEPMYTAVLVDPKPHHEDFYLNEEKRYVAGRKFYFHHSQQSKPLSANRLISMGGRPANRYIEPLDYDTQFHFRLNFTNLEADEFGALVLAVALEEQMRHKIGYGKPLGLGSIYLQPTRLTLIDYSSRYTDWKSGQGKTLLEGDSMWQVLYQHIDEFSDKYLQTLAMEDLRRIWHWLPEAGVNYYYPSKREWFDREVSKGKRIRDTRNVP
jgi:CRISPR/Cas system CSM-associated protein Csm3 (group 7 of RAMP superfamily)